MTKSLLPRLPASLLLSLILVLPAAAAPGNFVQLIPVTSGLSAPIGIVNAGDGSNRLFIVEQCGQIRIWNGSAMLSTPFLNLGSTGTNRIVCGGERGLLGLAFHPGYESNGLFYVYYTRLDDPATTADETGDIVVARYQVSANPNVASTVETPLLTIDHPAGNHNGGQIAFGPDGYLYIATGDGGGGGDPDENGQNINSLLGKILRIDVNSGAPYAIPAGNPFAGATPGRDEIWAYGLRNPWRFSFDRLTGDHYIGDVGQNSWEEIDVQAAGTPGGRNYGWDVLEGKHCFEDVPTGSCTSFLSGGSVLPVLEYDHSLGCSVTGGFVFRNLPSHSFYGNYLYSDVCSGRIWRAFSSGGTWTSQQLFDTAFGVSSFGESESGRIYFADLNGNTLQWFAPYTFQDVTPGFWAWPYVEALFQKGITTGCDATPRFCVSDSTSRAEMAVFLIRALRGGSFSPPPATGTFADVPVTFWAAPFIEQLYNDGITTGCADNPLRFCPSQAVTRAEMAVFLLRSRFGSSYLPPPATGTVFADVPASYWAAAWIEELYRQGITTGCASSPLRYCPDGSVNRAEMAAFLARTFSLPLP